MGKGQPGRLLLII